VGIKKTIEVGFDPSIKDIAELFCDLDADAQAEFFSEVAAIVNGPDWSFPMHLQYVTDSQELTAEGRSIMCQIGEYSEAVK
jgi:cytochrome c551/c552